MKYLDARELRDFGFLQEVNRQFFHTVGLALEVRVEEDGSVTLGGIWDCRDDPEGILFGEEGLDSDDAREKAARVRALRDAKAGERFKVLGWGKGVEVACLEMQAIPEARSSEAAVEEKAGS